MTVTNKIKKEISTKKVIYRNFPHVYKTPDGTWRGFVTPYDVTYEAKTRKRVEEVLPKLTKLYEEGLKKYNYPRHLTVVPLSDKDDIEEFNRYAEIVSKR